LIQAGVSGETGLGGKKEGGTQRFSWLGTAPPDRGPAASNRRGNKSQESTKMTPEQRKSGGCETTKGLSGSLCRARKNKKKLLVEARGTGGWVRGGTKTGLPYLTWPSRKVQRLVNGRGWAKSTKRSGSWLVIVKKSQRKIRWGKAQGGVGNGRLGQGGGALHPERKKDLARQRSAP